MPKNNNKEIEIEGKQKKYILLQSELDEMKESHQNGINLKNILSSNRITEEIVNNNDNLAIGVISTKIMV